MKARLVRWGKALAGFAVRLLVMAVILDGALWLFHPARTHEIHQRVQQVVPGVKPEIDYTVNSLGLRTTSLMTEKKPPRTVRIVCLGASTTNQINQNTEDMWSGVVEKRLQAAMAPAGWKVEVGAFGIGGATAYYDYQWAREHMEDLHPDIVVTLLGVNDLSYHGGVGYHFDRDKARGTSSDVLPRVLRYSQIYRYGARAFDRIATWRALRAGTAVDIHSERLPKLRALHEGYPFVAEPHRDPDPIVEFRAGVDDLLGWLDARGIKSVVMSQPTLWKPVMSAEEERAVWFPLHTPDGKVRTSGAWLEREMERFNAAQREVAEQHHARYVDVQIPKTLEMYFDECHYTDKGCVAVAEALYPTLLDAVREVASH